MEITKANPVPTPIQEAVVAVEATISAVPTTAVEAMAMTAVGATEMIAAEATTTVAIHTTMTDVVAETIKEEEEDEDQVRQTRGGTMLIWEAAVAVAGAEAAVTIGVIRRGVTSAASTVT